MKKLLKRLYWICILVCICMVTFCGSSSSEGVLAFFALAILIIVPIAKRTNKSSRNSADRWLSNRRIEIHADEVDYRTNMEIYKNMKKQADELKRRAGSTGGYERKQLLKEAEQLERDAQQYYRTLF